MRSLTDCAMSADSGSVRSDEHDLDILQRVSAEYREMPALILTVAQAARLFNIDAPRCARVLGALVDKGVLVTDGRTFSRADACGLCA